MKKTCRTDLGCERNIDRLNGHKSYMKEICGIPTILHTSEESKSTVSALLCSGKPYKYSDDYLYAVSCAIAKCISLLLPGEIKYYDSVLICGLGNRLVTSDSLGPLVTDRLYPTTSDKFNAEIFILSPGTEGQNGFSTFDMVKAAVTLSHCKLLIVIDSLCAKDPSRLGSTIQLSSLGIMPGSGVGNHKTEISEKSLSVPVIALGAPTVTELNTVTDSGSGEAFYASPSDVDLCVSSLADVIAKAVESLFYTKKG